MNDQPARRLTSLPAAKPAPAAVEPAGGVPPHNLDAEVSVLGGMLLSKDAIVEVLADAKLTAADFYRGAHRTMFEGIEHLHVLGQPVDSVTLADALAARGHLDDVGGAVGILDIVDKVPTAANALHYAKIVGLLAARRRLHTTLTDGAGRAFDLTCDPDAVAADVRAELLDRESSSEIVALDQAQMADLPKGEWLIGGDVLPDGFNLLYGASGSLKTFLAVDWACSVAAGIDWHGRPVRQSPVVYITAEGNPAAFQRRIDAWKTDRGVTVGDLYCVIRPVDLRDRRAAQQLSRVIGRLGARLVVIDTLARNMRGDESKTTEMREFIDNIDDIRHDNGCAALVVHHCGVEGGRPRGNSSLYAASDSVFVASIDEAEVMTASNVGPEGKAKDATSLDPFQLVKQRVGLSAGESSVVLVGANQTGSRGYALAALAQNGPSTWIDLVRHAGNAEVAKRMVADRQVVEVPGNPVRYAVASAGAARSGPAADPWANLPPGADQDPRYF